MSEAPTVPSISTPMDFSPLALSAACVLAATGAGIAVSAIAGERILLAALGDTDFNAVAAKVCLLGGLAVGAALLRSFPGGSARPLRVLAMLAAGAGATQMLAPFLMLAAGRLQSATGASTGPLRCGLALLACVAVFGLPAGMAGGMLPGAARALSRPDLGSGLPSDFLASSGILGAAGGAVVTWSWLVPGFGLRGTVFAGACLILSAAAASWWLDRSAREVGARDDFGAPEKGGASLVGTASWPAWAALGTGVAITTFGTAWARVLTLVAGATPSSLASMLSALLAGLALGALLLGALADRSTRPLRLLVAAHGVAGLAAVVCVMMGDRLSSLYLGVLRDVAPDADGVERARLLLPCLVLLPAGAALGAALPLLARLRGRGGSALGGAISTLAAGGAIGLLVSSLLLSAGAGVEWVARLSAGVCLALAFGDLLGEPGALEVRWAIPSGLGIVALTATLLLSPPWNPLRLASDVPFDPMRFYDERGRVLLDRLLRREDLGGWWEGPREATAVVRTTKGNLLRVDGLKAGSDAFEDTFSRRLLGHLAAALHTGRVGAACVVDLGSGATVDAIARHDVLKLTVVGETPGFPVAEGLLEPEGQSVWEDPRLDLRLENPRTFLALSSEPFDVIAISLDLPWRPRAALLSSRELLAFARGRLAPDGIFLWLVPLRRVPTEDVKALVATFCDVFPHVRLFATGAHAILAGRSGAFPRMDATSLEERFRRPEAAAGLKEAGVRGPLELLAYYQMDDAEAKALAGGARPITDDRPSLEKTAPRGLYADTLGPNLAELLARRLPPQERAQRLGFEGEARSSFLSYLAGADAALEGAALLSKGSVNEALERLGPPADSGQRLAGHVAAEYMEGAGIALQRRGDHEVAWSLLALSVHLEPERFDAMIGLAYADILLGRLDEAEKVLARAAESRPGDAEVVWRMGLLRERQGRDAEAESLYRQGVALEPLLPQPHALLGRRFLAQRAPDAALAEFGEAVRLGERSLEAFLGRVEALLALGRKEEALNRGREAVQFFPASAEALEALAVAADAVGKSEEAEMARRRRNEMLGGKGSEGRP